MLKHVLNISDEEIPIIEERKNGYFEIYKDRKNKIIKKNWHQNKIKLTNNKFMATNLEPKIPQGKDIEVVPEDVYEVAITDIKDKERTKYQSAEKEMAMVFVFTISEGDFKGTELSNFVSPSLFSGSQNANPSKLYQIFSAVYKKPLNEEDLMGIGTDEVNALIGKKLRVAIKQYQNQEGDLRNKIDSFLKSAQK